jgi:hypothetical protein
MTFPLVSADFRYSMSVTLKTNYHLMWLRKVAYFCLSTVCIIAPFSKQLLLRSSSLELTVARAGHEAFWIAFERPYGYDKFAIRVYCGGVNGISGEPMVPNMATLLKAKNNVRKKQDYIVVPPQPWLDGIAVEPGNVRQFVAVDTKSGRSIEEQITGSETVRGLQLEVVPPWNYSCPRAKFTKLDENGRRNPIYPGNNHPCEDVRLFPGDVVYMEHGRPLSRTIGDLINELRIPHAEIVNVAKPLTTQWISVFVESLGKEYAFEVTLPNTSTTCYSLVTY